MAGVLSGECSYSESGMRGEEDEDKEGVCTGSISNSAHHIPLDLTVEILTRLPAKSLKRFQCVSKEWLSTIRNQGFTDSFSSLSQTRPRILAAVRIDENRVVLLSSSHDETERSTTCLPTNLQMPIPGWHLFYPFRLTSSRTNLEMTVSCLPVDRVQFSCVHGLFSLLHPSEPGRFTICNPSTRQMITLPEAASGRREAVYMCLGYDPVGNEYKALCSTALCGEHFQEHKVLTLGGGNHSWRDTKGKKIMSYKVVTNGICINGIVYYGGWKIRGKETKIPWIFWFDVRGERVGGLSTYTPVITRGSLINYNGMLGSVYPRKPLGRFDIWVLELDKPRWLLKVFVALPLLSDLSGNIQLNLLGMNKANEIILGPVKLPPKGEPLYIYYYNKHIRGNFIRRVELEGFEEFGCNHTSDEQCVCQFLFSPEHFESLVSL